jgi:hypothetical protein
MKTWSQIFGVLCATVFILSLTHRSTATQRVLPNPVLFIKKTELVEIQGSKYMRYYFDVANKDAFPAEMFAAAPKLPACGRNNNSSRTWVDIYEQNGKRLNGFCALGKPDDLDGIWFSLEADIVPPSWIYIELTDRQTETKYKSNLAETTQ